jgi:hypothetical protein
MVERTNRVIKQTIKAYVEAHADWDRHLQAICFALRTTPNSSTGVSPARLTFGRELKDPFPVRAHLYRVRRCSIVLTSTAWQR